MHYTLIDIFAAAPMADETGWTKAVITLEKGDTVVSALSDKWVFAGPGEVEFLMHPSGWQVVPSDTVRKQYV